MSKIIVVNDQSRTYLEAKGLFTKEVSKGNATALKALPAPSTNLPNPIVSTLLQKTRGGSGTEAAEVRLSDAETLTIGDATKIQDLGIALHLSMRPATPEGIARLLDMVEALHTALAANSGQWLKEIFAGMHAE